MGMSSISHPRKEELRVNLLTLAEACPLDPCNPEDCPLFALRQMKPGERLQWFNALGEEDLEYLASYHHICLTTKLHSGLTEAGH
jgi:hypothetical protein